MNWWRTANRAMEEMTAILIIRFSKKFFILGRHFSYSVIHSEKYILLI